MRFVTFVKNNQNRLGLMGPADQVIDIAELNRRYLKAGSAPYLSSMQGFIEAGGAAVAFAKKAVKYVSDRDEEGQKKLRQGGALWKLNQVKIISPIPEPRKNVVLLGVNYKEHIEEGARARSIELKYPEAPVFFTKPKTAVIGHMGKVVHWKATEKLDYEVELAVIMGRKGRD